MKGLPVTMGLKTMRARMEKSGGARHDAVVVLALQHQGAVSGTMFHVAWHYGSH